MTWRNLAGADSLSRMESKSQAVTSPVVPSQRLFLVKTSGQGQNPPLGLYLVSLLHERASMAWVLEWLNPEIQTATYAKMYTLAQGTGTTGCMLMEGWILRVTHNINHGRSLHGPQALEHDTYPPVNRRQWQSTLNIYPAFFTLRAAQSRTAKGNAEPCRSLQANNDASTTFPRNSRTDSDQFAGSADSRHRAEGTYQPGASRCRLRVNLGVDDFRRHS